MNFCTNGFFLQSIVYPLVYCYCHNTIFNICRLIFAVPSLFEHVLFISCGKFVYDMLC